MTRSAVADPLWSAADVASAAQLACLLEAHAPKPGNVSPGRNFADATFHDFVASAAAIGPALAGVGTRPLGATVRLAIEATGRWTRSNTNLGIVLLLTPIARAASLHAGAIERRRDDLQLTVRRVLAGTTVDDAREVYTAIRTARPGGLGTVGEQDVAGEPTMPLLDVMMLAAGRDAVAREYTSGFELTFAHGAPALDRARGDGLDWNDAIVETFLTLLAATPDTHVSRRHGDAVADEVSAQARQILAAGSVRTEAGRRAIDAMDGALRHRARPVNPGTTADLTTAAIFVVLLGGAWNRESGGGHGTTR